MAGSGRLVEDVFDYYANFGSGVYGSDVLDSAKFAKLCRETRLMNRREVTLTDVDLVYKKSIPKGERKMTYPQFLSALKLLGTLRYPTEDSDFQFQRMVEILIENKPAVLDVQQTDGITERLTDPALYTGMYKNKFEDRERSRSRGRERAVRDKVNARARSQSPTRHSRSNEPHLATFLRPNLHRDDTEDEYIQRGYLYAGNDGRTAQRRSYSAHAHNQPTTPPSAYYQTPAVNQYVSTNNSNTVLSTHSQSSAFGKPRASSPMHHHQAITSQHSIPSRTYQRPDEDYLYEEDYYSAGGTVTRRSRSNANRYGHNKTTVPDTGSGVFARLTNHRGYTGSHKHRFNADGTGRGLRGRDIGGNGYGTVAKVRDGAPIHDLSQITRSTITNDLNFKV